MHVSRSTLIVQSIATHCSVEEATKKTLSNPISSFPLPLGCKASCPFLPAALAVRLTMAVEAFMSQGHPSWPTPCSKGKERELTPHQIDFRFPPPPRNQVALLNHLSAHTRVITSAMSSRSSHLGWKTSAKTAAWLMVRSIVAAGEARQRYRPQMSRTVFKETRLGAVINARKVSFLQQATTKCHCARCLVASTRAIAQGTRGMPTIKFKKGCAVAGWNNSCECIARKIKTIQQGQQSQLCGQRPQMNTFQ